MLKKALAVTLCSAATLAWAEPQRTLLTHENQFPELGQLEVGYQFQQREFNTFNYRSHSAQARFGLWENLTLNLDVPWVQRDEDFAEDEDGAGDVVLGFDLLAYEDVFTYPYVIPHIEIGFPTGDDDKGLGSGETMYAFGVSIGTVVYDVLHYVLDLTYAANYDALATEEDDVFMGSLSLIWELSDRFNWTLEGGMVDYQDTDDEPFIVGGGFAYKWTPNFQTSFFYGGWQEDSEEDTTLNARATYTF